MFPVNVPNVLTVLRILLVPVLVVALLDETPNGDLLAAIVFAVASLTDEQYVVVGQASRRYVLLAQRDQSQEPLRQQRADEAETDCQQREPEDARRGGEVAELVVSRNGVLSHGQPSGGPDGGGTLLEEHPWRAGVRLHRRRQVAEDQGQLVSPCRLQPLDAADQPLLCDIGRAADDAAGPGRQRQLDAAAVGRRTRAGDQSERPRAG